MGDGGGRIPLIWAVTGHQIFLLLLCYRSTFSASITYNILELAWIALGTAQTVAGYGVVL